MGVPRGIGIVVVSWLRVRFENAFALARELKQCFDGSGRFRQSFVSELAMLRREHHVMRFNLTAAGPSSSSPCAPPRGSGVQCMLVPVVGTQMEIKARLINKHGDSSVASSWGVVVFGSQDLSEGTQANPRLDTSSLTGLRHWATILLRGTCELDRCPRARRRSCTSVWTTPQCL